jgi:YHYH protein
MSQHLHPIPPPAHHHHDDGHHDHDPTNPNDVSRRHLLYLISAGLLGTAVLGSTASARGNRRPPTTFRRTKTTPALPRSAASSAPATSSVPGTSVMAAPTTAASSPTSAVVDPWSLFPRSVQASRSATEVIVESTGMPEHLMMVGITNWQQQVPLPQPYSGSNSWRFPAQGVLADAPISTKTDLFRGAIALAINGVPIFNALNNRGEDSFLIGELDQWGGHCGRADDYHYHAAPLHLARGQSPAVPIAFALDGFPIYGLIEPDGSPVRSLDMYNGHADSKDTYHYHATLTYPYINGGMRGKVQVKDGQLDPQPMLAPIRPAGAPLRGASITAFSQTAPNAWRLQYKLNGGSYQVDYSVNGSTYSFVFTDPAGTAKTETFRARPITG